MNNNQRQVPGTYSKKLGGRTGGKLAERVKEWQAQVLPVTARTTLF